MITQLHDAACALPPDFLGLDVLHADYLQALVANPVAVGAGSSHAHFARTEYSVPPDERFTDAAFPQLIHSIHLFQRILRSSQGITDSH